MRARETGVWPIGAMRTGPIFGRLGRFSEDMKLMCERFRLVEVLGA
jgi:hypothetical protein